jgi:hypothetical protein
MGVAAATFVGLNPFLTAHPKSNLPAGIARIARLGPAGRMRYLLTHRVRATRVQQESGFRPYALTTPVDKIKVAAVQGFGRFGPLGPQTYDRLASERRFEWAQDRGALIWLPWVCAGLAWAVARGRRQWTSGAPPTAWAIAVQAVVAAVVVTAYLPLAWDRYLLPLQPGSALLAAGVATAAMGRVRTAALPLFLRNPLGATS